MSNEKKMYLKLLSRALLDIRIEAYETNNKRIFEISNLFHNVPDALLSKTKNKSSYKTLLKELHEKAEHPDVKKWLEHAKTDICIDEPKI